MGESDVGNVAQLIELHLAKFEVHLENINRKLDELMVADKDAKHELQALEARVRELELNAAKDRMKLALLVGGAGLVSGGAGSFIKTLLMGG